MKRRRLGSSRIEVSALGLGCWAIGGPYFRGDEPLGWGRVDDAESIRAIWKALDLGITFFDTSDFYGCGRSERMLGRALKDRRDRAVIATKFGYRIDETRAQVQGQLDLPRELRAACDASLHRLGTDYLDLYLLHLRDLEPETALAVRDELEALVREGRIRGYGWSTDDLERAQLFAQGEHCIAIEQAQNALQGNRELLRFCEGAGIAAIARSPLLMGALAGRAAASRSSDDIRSRLDPERVAAIAAAVESLRGLLTQGGRTLAQGALCWLFTRSPALVPIPGFRTAAQVEENAAALRFGPFDAATMEAIDVVAKELELPPDPLAMRRDG